MFSASALPFVLATVILATTRPFALVIVLAALPEISALTQPIGSVQLAPHVYLTRNLLAAGEAALVREQVLRAEAYPCPLQEQKWPHKRCAKVPVPAVLIRRLSSALPRLDLSSLTTIAASVDLASDTGDHSMRHHHHFDVYPERERGVAGPDATVVIYLSQAPAEHPAALTAPTVFPRAGVTVVPQVGAMLAWSNVLDSGAPNPAAEHGVGPYAGASLPPRVAFHIPIGVGPSAVNGSAASQAPSSAHAHAEHVGCGGPPLAWRRYWLAVRNWTLLAQRLRRHVEETLMRKFRAVGRLVGMLLTQHARACERVYAPGSIGYENAAAEFTAALGQATREAAHDSGSSYEGCSSSPAGTATFTLASSGVAAAAAAVAVAARGGRTPILTSTFRRSSRSGACRSGASGAPSRRAACRCEC